MPASYPNSQRQSWTAPRLLREFARQAKEAHDGYRGERGLRTMKELAIAAITLIVWKKESARTVSWAECRDKKWSGIEPRGRFFS